MVFDGQLTLYTSRSNDRTTPEFSFGISKCKDRFDAGVIWSCKFPDGCACGYGHKAGACENCQWTTGELKRGRA
jgi:hypothetical protein